MLSFDGSRIADPFLEVLNTANHHLNGFFRSDIADRQCRNSRGFFCIRQTDSRRGSIELEFFVGHLHGRNHQDAIADGRPRLDLFEDLQMFHDVCEDIVAADIHIEIEDALSAPAAAPSPMSIPARALWKRALPSVLTGLVVAAVAVGIAIWNRPAPAPQPVSRTVITLPAGDRLPPADQRALALSPDGKLLAYVAIHDAVQQLYLRAIDGFEAKAVAGTEGAIAPFFSPDSQWIGFHAAGKLKKVSVGRGAVVTLSDVSAPIGHGSS